MSACLSRNIHVLLLAGLCACSGAAQTDVADPAFSLSESSIDDACAAISIEPINNQSVVATPGSQVSLVNGTQMQPCSTTPAVGSGVARPSVSPPASPALASAQGQNSKPPVAASAPPEETSYPQYYDWYCFEYWQDGYRKYKMTSLCKRTKELCQEAQQRMRKPGQSVAECTFRDKAYCVRMRVHILESEYMDCSETWHQCMGRKSMETSEPKRYKALSECDERD